MIKILNFNQWFNKWEDDLVEAFSGLDNPHATFDEWSKDQYKMWREDAEERNGDI